MRHELAYLLIGVLFCAACSLTSLQSPEVLPPGHTSVGLGLSYYPASYLPEGDLCFRHGISSNIDMGAKIAVPALSISGDVKCQLLKNPLLMALDFGGSYGYAPPIPDETGGSGDIITAYPELIVGNNRFYGALRPMIVYSIGHSAHPGGAQNSYADWFPQVFAGGSFGHRFVVMPEVSLGFWRQDGSTYLLPGFGAAFQWRP